MHLFSLKNLLGISEAIKSCRKFYLLGPNLLNLSLQCPHFKSKHTDNFVIGTTPLLWTSISYLCNCELATPPLSTNITSIIIIKSFKAL